MGLFSLPKSDKSGDLAQCAIENIQLFLDDWKHDRGTMICSQDYPNDYLLWMAINDLQKALVQYKTECDQNSNINPSKKTHLLK